MIISYLNLVFYGSDFGTPMIIKNINIMKNKNYYQVHKNKKPKQKSQLVNLNHLRKVICFTKELVKAITEMSKAMSDLKSVTKPIPDYTKGCVFNGKMGIVGGGNHKEIIIDAYGRRREIEHFILAGKKIQIPPPIDFNDFPKHIGKYKEITEELRKQHDLILKNMAMPKDL